MQDWIKRLRPSRVTLAAPVALLALAGGVAVASTADMPWARTAATKQLRGCVRGSDRTLRIPAAGRRCGRGEQAISWNTQGPAGERGEDGARGPAGTTGPAGAAARDGAPGPTGRDGRPGEKGDSGERGATGTPGEQGEPGRDGAPGTPGTSGEPGRDGAAGLRGEPGSDGGAGPQGEPGPQGLRGPQGVAGANSPLGVTVDTPLTIPRATSATVASLTLPPGTYSLTAHVQVTSATPTDPEKPTAALCRLVSEGRWLGDEGAGGTASTTVPGVANALGFAVLPAGGTIDVVCRAIDPVLAPDAAIGTRAISALALPVQ